MFYAYSNILSTKSSTRMACFQSVCQAVGPRFFGMSSTREVQFLRIVCRKVVPYRWQKKYCNKMDEARPRNLENLGNLGSKKIPKIKIIKIKIRVAQNVGKVWISRKKQLPAPFGAIPGHFLRGPEKSKKC